MLWHALEMKQLARRRPTIEEGGAETSYIMGCFVLELSKSFYSRTLCTLKNVFEDSTRQEREGNQSWGPCHHQDPRWASRRNGKHSDSLPKMKASTLTHFYCLQVEKIVHTEAEAKQDDVKHPPKVSWTSCLKFSVMLLPIPLTGHL